MNPKTPIYISLILGIIVSIYLTIVHYETNLLACPNTGIINCESVITSAYSQIGPVPIAILGLVLFLLGFYFLFNNENTRFMWYLAGSGAILYSLTAQFLLGEVCIYCLALDVIIFSTITLSIKMEKLQKMS